MFEIEDDEDEPEEIDYSHLPSVTDAEALRPLLAQAGQAVYDDWSQDESGYDEEHGGGGVCHVIADKMLEVLYGHIPNLENASTVSATDEVHVYIVAQFREGIFVIDIPWRYYESGGGYNWTKTPGVTFEPDFVYIGQIDGDPGAIETYVDY